MAVPKISISSSYPPPEEKSLRVVVIGDPKIGKTSLITRWTSKKTVDLTETLLKTSPSTSPRSTSPRGSFSASSSSLKSSGGSPSNSNSSFSDATNVMKLFNSEFQPLSVTLQDKKFKLTFLDGSEWCEKVFNKSLSEEQASQNPFLGVDGIFLCYDLTNSETFEDLDRKWKVQLDKFNIITDFENIALVVVGCKADQPAVIDTTLIKFMKKYIDEEVSVSGLTGAGMDECLSIMIGSIMNRSPVPKMVDPKRGDVGGAPHQFEIKYFSHPTWCKFCDLFIWGVHKPQGYQCKVCKYPVHKKCKDFVPHYCGISE